MPYSENSATAMPTFAASRRKPSLRGLRRPDAGRPVEETVDDRARQVETGQQEARALRLFRPVEQGPIDIGDLDHVDRMRREPQPRHAMSGELSRPGAEGLHLIRQRLD